MRGGGRGMGGVDNWILHIKIQNLSQKQLSGREVVLTSQCAFLCWTNKLWQIERAHQKHRHLGAGDRVFGAVVAIPAAGGDALSGKLFDPGGSPVAR